MPRFYCPFPLIAGSTVTLPAETARHVQVLRLATGDALTLFDGTGGEYAARMSHIGKKTVDAEILTFAPREAELPYAITLAQGLPEASKMDWIVEKAVELGVAAILPLAARRSVVKLSGERAEKRLAHWQRTVVAASEQCGRNRLARVEDVTDFSRWIEQPTDGIRLMLSPRAKMSLSQWVLANPPQAVTFMIGPEGGFAPEEEDLAISQGALPLSMGPRVLRTETAGIAALATLNAVWSEI